MAQQDKRREQARERQSDEQSTTLQRSEGARRGGLAPRRAESSLARVMTDMDWMFDQMRRGVLGGLGRLPNLDVRVPNLAIEDTDDAIVLNAEIPGVDPQDLQLEYRDGILTIRAEKQEEDDEEDGSHFSRYASFYHQITLPPEADVDRAEASVKNGVLTIRLPKLADAENVKRIPIKSEERRQAA